MKTIYIMCCSIVIFFLGSNAYALTALNNFLTPQDFVSSDFSSGINLHNNRRVATTVFGLYVHQFSSVQPGDTCNHATVMYPGSQDITAGAFVTPIVIPAGKSATVGGNYLYNLLYDALYYISIIYPSSPPGCALPGCTWGSDTTQYNWCIYLGALAPVTHTAEYTANVPPATSSASSVGNYNYNLIKDYHYLGPISCDDQTLSCHVANQQTQSFS